MSLSFPQLAGLVPTHVQKAEAYIPSKPDDILQALYKAPFLYRMNNNENSLGPTHLARQAIAAFHPPMAAVYPSGDAYHLRCRLAEIFGHHADCYLIGNGANEVIAFVIKAFCREGDNIITADRTFAVYEWVAEFSGFEARLVPLKDHGFDDDAMLEAMDERTKVIFICNPNNPTGSYWTEEKLRGFLKKVNNRCIVVLDEAYAEFVEAVDFPDGLKLLDEYPNLVVFRTFSKMYGLASLRIGYLAGQPDVVGIIRKTCVVYSVNGPAQAAALATLNDGAEHIVRTRALVRESKEYLLRGISDMHVPYIAGEGNYVILHMPGSDTLVYRKLMQQGYMVRTMTGFRMPNHIRVTLQPLHVMEGFLHALKAVLIC